MSTIYHYVDECYRETGGYWHCNIGGALIEASLLVDTEVALEKLLYGLAISLGFPYAQGEFKYAAFFPDTSDDFKFAVAQGLASELLKRNVRFLVSHAKMQKAKLKAVLGFSQPAQMIQQLAYFNIDNYLAPLRATHLVQRVIDLGISESFRPVYEQYVAMIRGLYILKARDIPDDQITIANYRNLPMPLFLDSRNSRLLQFSDLLIGLLLARETGGLTPFKQELVNRIAPIMSNVEVFSVEWNKDGP